MKLHLTAQQLSFYTAHGYIAFEEMPLDLSTIEKELQTLLKKNESKREFWRLSQSLQQILVRKIGPLALQLSRRRALHVAFDELIGAADGHDYSAPIQDHLSFQGLSCVVALIFDGKSPTFFMHPSCWPALIAHWPKEPTDCYLIGFGTEETLYIMNSTDPQNHYYKKFGFGFGDSIGKNPLII